MADAIDQLSIAVFNSAKSTMQAKNYPYEVWNKIAPSTVKEDAYVLITVASGSSANVKQMRIERISVTIGVYARNANINTDVIAGDIKNGIVDGNNNILIALDNAKLKVTYLNHSDNNPDAFVGPGATFINRFITLNFQVVTYS